MKTSGCLRCHFRYVEEHALPCVPLGLRTALRRRQQRLVALGFPRRDVLIYACWELDAARVYCSPEVIERIEADFERLELGHAEAIAR